MRESLISVVIPVFNCEEYLKDCIDSIMKQSYDNYEIILIDDGSKDMSGKICDEYAALYSHIRTVHQENRGNLLSRKKGVQEARGEWVTFVDADDTLEPKALELLFEVAKNTDLVIGFPNTPIKKFSLSLEECRKNAITGELFPPAPWAKLYRRNLLDEHIFDLYSNVKGGEANIKNKGGEDMLMNIRYMFSIKRPPHFVFQKIYNLTRNTVSISHSKRASLVHEEAFNDVRKASIPVQIYENYIHEIIRISLNGLVACAYFDTDNMTVRTHPYLVQLMNDIKQYHYKLSFKEWLLIHIHNPLVLKSLAFCVFAKNSIKYRLGLNN